MGARRAWRRTTWIDRLRSIQLLADCSDRELRFVDSLCTAIDVPGGRTLLAQGDRCSQFFISARGIAVVSIDQRPVALVEAGSFFGDHALLGDGGHPATVTSATPMELLVFSRMESATLLAAAIPSIEAKVSAVRAERRRALAQVAEARGRSSVLEHLGDLPVLQRAAG